MGSTDSRIVRDTDDTPRMCRFALLVSGQKSIDTVRNKSKSQFLQYTHRRIYTLIKQSAWTASNQRQSPAPVLTVYPPLIPVAYMGLLCKQCPRKCRHEICKRRTTRAGAAPGVSTNMYPPSHTHRRARNLSLLRRVISASLIEYNSLLAI